MRFNLDKVKKTLIFQNTPKKGGIMKKRVRTMFNAIGSAKIFLLTLLSMVFFVTFAFAGEPGGGLLDFISDSLWAKVATGAIALLGLGNGAALLFIKKLIKTGKEMGEVQITIAKAIEDDSITKEELQSIVKEIGDVKKIWS